MHVNSEIAALLEGLNNPSLPGIDLSLVRMRELLVALGNPEKKLPPVVHFAGTNGKGSTLAFLRAIYQAQGYRVHAYTSPHLVAFNERVVIAGAEISDAYLLQLLTRIRDVSRNIAVTFFEATTALTFLAFAEHSADVVLLETGLGGRLDATNVVDKPVATVITPIDYDHMEFLGETLTQIAVEKAGIMKRDVPCFIGEQKPEAREVLKRVGREKSAPIFLHGREWSYEAVANAAGRGVQVYCGKREWVLPSPGLTGAHQYHNAALASVVAQSLPGLPVTEAAVVKGIASAQWPARLQTLSAGPIVAAWGARGDVLLDGGHNVSAALALAEWLAQQEKPVTLLWGMMARKDAAAFLAVLKDKLAGVIAVPIPGNDAYDPAALAEVAREAGIAQVSSVEKFEDLPGALASAADGGLLIAGSLFLAGEVLKNHS